MRRSSSRILISAKERDQVGLVHRRRLTPRDDPARSCVLLQRAVAANNVRQYILPALSRRASSAAPRGV